MQHHDQDDMQQAAALCWQCRHTCQETFFTHCLQIGGAHVAPKHVEVMADCIAICQLAADMMVRKSPQHAAVCRACAEICDACAQSCAEIGGEEMTACAEICRRCAASCHAMSGETRGATLLTEAEVSHMMA